jgi:quercetin dioxygenase-like cupin family protein
MSTQQALATEPIDYLGMQVLMRVTKEMSGGTFQAFEHITPPGTGVPLHTHPLDEEHLFVERGRLRCRVGEETFVAETGDAVPLPPGIPHAWSADGDETALVLVVVTLTSGADFERMFRRLSAAPPEDFEAIADEITRDHGVEVVLPFVLA